MLILAFLALFPLPVSAQASDPPPIKSALVTVDLRAKRWMVTTVVQNGQGVVQHLGDDRFPTGIPGLLLDRLGATLQAREAKEVRIKTADLRLSVPDARLDPVLLSTTVAQHGLIAAPVLSVLSSFSKNKMASAVFCLNVDGDDYIGSNGHLFRYGAEEELREAIDLAMEMLNQNLATKMVTSNIACQPGWEGGQAVPD